MLKSTHKESSKQKEPHGTDWTLKRVTLNGQCLQIYMFQQLWLVTYFGDQQVDQLLVNVKPFQGYITNLKPSELRRSSKQQNVASAIYVSLSLSLYIYIY